MKYLLIVLLASTGIATAQQQPAAYPHQTEGDYKIKSFPFQSGETSLAELNIHYTTLGQPVRDNSGKVSTHPN